MRKLWQDIKCKLGFHPSVMLYWQPAPGGRDVKKCYHCGKVLEEKKCTLNEARNAKRNSRKSYPY